MGSIIYDFLAESILFDEQRVADDFANVTAQELEAELEKYRAYCIQNYDALKLEIGSDPAQLNLFFDDPSKSAPFARAALYADKCVIEDPLIALSSKRNRSNAAFDQMLGTPSNPDLDKPALARVAREMKQNTALASADFLKYFPTSLSFEGPEEIPIVASDNGFEDVLPEKLLQKLKEAADVSSMENLGGGRFRMLEKRAPCRNISIEFDPLAFRETYGYMLFDSDFQVVDEEKRLVRAAMNPGASPPDPLRFQAWVKQSVNQAAYKFYTRGLFAAQLASFLNCVYSTRSNLLFSILPKTADVDSSAVCKNADLFMNLEVPFLEGLSAENLVNLRRDEGEAFANFRVAIDARLRALQEIEDPQKASRLARQSLYELSNSGVNELKTKLRSIQEKFAWNAFLMTAGILGSVQTAGFSLLSTIAGTKGMGDTFLEYRKEVKRHPAYFLWKLAKQK